MIIKMKRVTLVAHKADEAALLKALQATQAVELIETGDEPGESQALTRADGDVQKLKDALQTLKPFSGKKSLLAARPEVTVGQISDCLPEALSFSTELQDVAQELAKTRSDIEKNENTAALLKPWTAFPADMQTYQSAKTVHYFTGLLGAADQERLKELSPIAEYEFFSDGAVLSTVVACQKQDMKTVANFLKSLDWTDFVFPKLTGTPSAAIAALEKENCALAQRKQELEQQLAQKATGSGEMVEQAYDAAVIHRDRVEAGTELARTQATIRMEGWVPENRIEDVKKAVSQVTDACYLEVRDPAEDETPPSVVKNNEFNTPFEQVTNLYSRPDPNGIDATPYMAPFYVLLFGLMLSDTGYGLILAIGCALFIKLKKPTGMSGGLAKVLFWGGLSTMVWGVLVGTFFGMDFDTLFGTVDKFPLLVDPMSDPISMLILCFGLGVLHILFGIGLKIKMSLQRGDWQTAIFDNLSWILIILGLIMLALPATKTVGTVMAIIGALMILLFKGREKKNVFSRTVSGLGELYQVTSYLSDVLSYARLFALGIATGVIASVFNELCGMLMSAPNIILKILGIIVACALLVALHLFNIGINTLGAFVHCARLQYVEFYGKFYEAGGKEFKPLGYKTRHVRISEVPSATVSTGGVAVK